MDEYRVLLDYAIIIVQTGTGYQCIIVVLVKKNLPNMPLYKPLVCFLFGIYMRYVIVKLLGQEGLLLKSSISESKFRVNSTSQ